MGIQGLLPFLKKASREAHLRDFKGQTAAVDAYCWLHKGAFSCADKLVRGEPTDGYVIYMMKQISLMLNNYIKPILVFDGCNLPSKAGTELKRRENRERNRKKAKELLREGRTREARECFQRCVDITSEMAAEVIEACRARNVDIIVAPYEADSQLAYLNQCGIAQLVITEDSDLVLFGCKNVLFKMDSNGGCVLVDSEKLHLSMNVPRDKFCFSKFRNMCILSGCDYLPSLPGIGLAKSCKFFNVTSNPDIHNALCKLPSYLNMPHLEVNKGYRDGFIQAINTFLYQLVFDPITRQLRPLNDYPDDTGPDDYPYAGKFIGHEKALQIALGNVNVQTGAVVGYFSPETYKPPAPKSSGWRKHGDVCAPHPSMWGNNNNINKNEALTSSAPAIPSIVPQSTTPHTTTTTGKERTIPTPIFKRKKQELDESDITEGDLQSLYSLPEKRKKHNNNDKEEHVQEDDLHLSMTQETSSVKPEERDSMESEGDSGRVSDHFSSPEEQKPNRRNPFAKSQSVVSKLSSGSQFSALKRFSKMKKTIVDQNTVVQSRYFASSTTSNSNSATIKTESTPNTPVPAPENTVECKQDVLPTNDTEKMSSKSKSDNIFNPDQSEEPPLSPIDSNFEQKTRTTFKWNKLSEVYSHSKPITVETSKATKYKFKCVNPQTKEQKENHCDTSSLEESSEESPSTSSSQCNQSSQKSSCTNDVCSIDNDSFNLTPASSLPLTPIDNDSINLTPVSLPPTPVRQTSIPTKSKVGEKFKKSGVKTPNRCRAPGLSKSANKRKSGPGPKQLSLTDMFGFKKEEKKLQAVGPIL
ncbi:hypothetical protein Pmani_039699 [Petrolisthes manimaculis]|uniref:Exonuclease 1 n=1 Tax=Petrolisthes manimaculis TaxID=1843537 RepID=A0AAE1TL39_9EUCA|nr:hypothetical protein Pmani_039699 [Petrolisthes manimaculis]